MEEIKVGDKVVLLRDSLHYSAGYVGTVTSVPIPGVDTCYRIDGNAVHPNRIKLYERKSMTGKFKVGDRVLVHAKTKGWTKDTDSYVIKELLGTGQPGYITDVRDDYYVVNTRQGGGGDYFAEADLTLYKENEVKESYTHRAGYAYEKDVIQHVEIDGDDYVITKDTDDGIISIDTVSNLEHEGWSLKSDIKELTLAEVAKLAGVDVSKLRIKD